MSIVMSKRRHRVGEKSEIFPPSAISIMNIQPCRGLFVRVDTGYEHVLDISTIKKPLLKVVSSVRILLWTGLEVCPSTAPIF